MLAPEPVGPMAPHRSPAAAPADEERLSTTETAAGSSGIGRPAGCALGTIAAVDVIQRTCVTGRTALRHDTIRAPSTEGSRPRPCLLLLRCDQRVLAGCSFTMRYALILRIENYARQQRGERRIRMRS